MPVGATEPVIGHNVFSHETGHPHRGHHDPPGHLPGDRAGVGRRPAALPVRQALGRDGDRGRAGSATGRSWPRKASRSRRSSCSSCCAWSRKCARRRRWSRSTSTGSATITPPRAPGPDGRGPGRLRAGPRPERGSGCLRRRARPIPPPPDALPNRRPRVSAGPLLDLRLRWRAGQAALGLAVLLTCVALTRPLAPGGASPRFRLAFIVLLGIGVSASALLASLRGRGAGEHLSFYALLVLALDGIGQLGRPSRAGRSGRSWPCSWPRSRSRRGRRSLSAWPLWPRCSPWPTWRRAASRRGHPRSPRRPATRAWWPPSASRSVARSAASARRSPSWPG